MDRKAIAAVTGDVAYGPDGGPGGAGNWAMPGVGAPGLPPGFLPPPGWPCPGLGPPPTAAADAALRVATGVSDLCSTHVFVGPGGAVLEVDAVVAERGRWEASAEAAQPGWSARDLGGLVLATRVRF